MKRTLLLQYLLLWLCTCANAQKYAINGYIKNFLTHEAIDSTTVTFMNEDSTVVKVFSPPTRYWKYQMNDTLPHAGTYIIKVEKKGYETAWKKQTFKYVPHRVTEGTFGTIYLTKIRNVNLQEVVVKATKVKMVVRGDTVVFNADAFNLSEGSMLDKLVEMLPGMKISHEGEITFNGRKVEELLVNGKDFFNGDASVALKNLPAYMVNKVKMYDRMSFSDKALGYTPDEKRSEMPLVMDVNLKKQYEEAWIGNVSTGYGTSSHYAARAFALRFTKQSNVAFYGNTSDMSGDSYYDSKGAWKSPGDSHFQAGLIRSTQAGLNVSVDDKDNKWQVKGNSVFKNRQNTDKSIVSTVSFLQGGDVFSREKSKNTNRTTQNNTEITVNTNPWKNATIEMKGLLKYQYHKNTLYTLNADYSNDIVESYWGETLDSLFNQTTGQKWRDKLIQSLKTNTLGIGHDLNAHLELTGRQRFGMDQLDFFASGELGDSRNRSLSHYADHDMGSRKDRFADYNANSYNLNSQIIYNMNLSNLWGWDRVCFSPSYEIKHSYKPSHNPYYALENSIYADWDLERLTISEDTIGRCIDFDNSYNSRLWTTEQTFALGFMMIEWTKGKGQTTISLTMPLRHMHEKIDYERCLTDTLAEKNRLFFEPQLNYRFFKNDKKRRLSVSMATSISHEAPTMLQQLNYRDETTPLVVRTGNPLLDASRQYKANFDISNTNNQTLHSWYANISYTLYQHQICQHMAYDRTTGVRTYQPSNIEGNWRIAYNGDFNMPLDKRKLWWIGCNTLAGYRNYVEYTSVDGENSQRSSIRRCMLGLSPYANFQKGDYRLSLNASVNWSNMRGNLSQTTNILESSCKLAAIMPLAWGVTLNSTFSLYSHRGYKESNYNNEEFIWSASLTKPALKNKLLFTLDFFDILDNIRSTSYSISAQTQKEIYRNTLHRYAMLHVAYKLNFKPKKKGK